MTTRARRTARRRGGRASGRYPPVYLAWDTRDAWRARGPNQCSFGQNELELSGEVRGDLGGRRLTVGGGEAFGERARLQVVLLRAGALQGVHGHQVAELGAALEGQAPGDGGEETRAERVARAGRVRGAGVGHRGDRHRRQPGLLDPRAVLAEGGNPDP